MHHQLQQLPELGIGIGFRRQISEAIFSNSGEIDWLEIISENFMNIGGSARELLEQTMARFPVIPHGVNLSVGGTDPLNRKYLQQLHRLLEDIDSPWVSDHLCYTSSKGRYAQQLLPLPRTKEVVKHVVARVREVQETLERPFLLENITYYMTFSESTMSEAEFLSEVCEKADCGILLDLNNIVVNAKNFALDEREFIDGIDKERVVQMHIAGHKTCHDWVLDTHAEPVTSEVYDFLDYSLRRLKPKAILLERDDNFADFAEILSELRTIRECASRADIIANTEGALQCH